VFGAPGDLLIQTYEARGDAAERKCLFSGVNIREQMHFDAAGQAEATFDGSIN